MPGTRVPFFAHSGQIPLSIITIFSCGLSFWLTVRFCGNLAPGHAAFELLAIGTVWELAKIAFGSVGAQCVRGSGDERLGWVLLSVSLVLAGGSIVASLAFLTQTDNHIAQATLHASQQALYASKAYERETASLNSVDDEIKELTALAEQYRGKGLLTQGVRTMDRVRSLRDERNAQAQTLSAQEASIANQVVTTVGGPLLGGSTTWRFTAQVVLAVMLEVIGMISMSLLRGRGIKSSKGGDASTSNPAPSLVRLKVASHCIGNDASMHRNASGTTSHETDAEGLQSPLHRPGANPASFRINTDASLHRPASDIEYDDAKSSTPSAGPRCIRVRNASMHTVRDAQTLFSESLQKSFDVDEARALSAIRSGEGRRLQTLYARAKELVCTAQVQPRYRDMQRALGASQHVVQRCLRNLVDEGILRRTGVRYALVSSRGVHRGAV